MPKSRRERLILLAAMFVVAFFVLDHVVIEPYFTWRDDLKRQAISDEQQLAEEQKLLALKAHYSSATPAAVTDLPATPSVTETRLLHALHRWEHQSEVSDTSFERMQSREEAGFNLLSFHVTANGTLAQIATLLYRFESSELPLRLDEVHLVPLQDATHSLQLQLNVSTLCKSTRPPATGTPQLLAGAQ